tara:strand:+ start:9998 stop:10543 length:546 start_codon:yes stop_codon:yes gene_type:complete
MKNFPSIPGVPRNFESEERRFFNAVKQSIEQLTGVKGGRAGTAVLVEDLTATGVVLDTGTALTSGAELISPAPDGPVSPTRPTNFSVSGSSTVVTISWDKPRYQNHLRTEIRASGTNTIASATKITNATGTSITLTTPSGLGTSLYFWGRHIKQDGSPSDYHATSGELLNTETSWSTIPAS